MQNETYCDKHLHLSGGTDPVLLWELVSEGGLKTHAKNYWEFQRTMTARRENVHNQEDYLQIIHTIDTAQSSPAAIQQCTYNCFTSSYLNGCRELQMRWNPVKRSQEGRIDLDRLVVAARSGMEQAGTTFGIVGSMLLCLGRDCSDAENEATLTMALRYAGKGVEGIDTAGPEDQPLQKKHPYLKHYYHACRARKLVTTCHCAETFNPWTEDELAYVLETLRPQRLGHGVQIHRFPKLMQLASQQGTELEICLTSNLTTGVISSQKQFRKVLNRLETHQVKFSFHTDATFLLNTNIRNEHKLAAQIAKA
jgi:adenosine deaminase